MEPIQWILLVGGFFLLLVPIWRRWRRRNP
jgi:hypothetical protein